MMAGRTTAERAPGLPRGDSMGDKTTTGPFGRGDLMAIAAFRYCLGRATYIVSDCVEWLIEKWPVLNENARRVITRDLADTFECDDRARRDGSEYRSLGHDCDRYEWERLRKHIDRS